MDNNKAKRRKMVKEDRRKGVLLNGHSLRWWGKGGDMLEENEGHGFTHQINQGCPGLCNDKSKRKVAIAVAVDCVPGTNRTVVFTDIDYSVETPRRIGSRVGRGIVVIDGI